MAFCTNCGSQVRDGIKFCPNCGAKFSSPVEEVQPQQRQTYQQQAAQQPVQQQTYQQPAQQQTYQQQPVQQPVQQQTYQQPVQQQTYQQPAQQQTYQQQQYQPQQSYIPPQQPKQPKQNKGGNKTLIFIIGGVVLAAIIAVAAILLFGGKGGAADIWTAVSADVYGIEMDISDIYQEDVTLEFKKNGKCVLSIDGAELNGKWKLDGEDLTITGSGIDCTGTMTENKLVITDLFGTGMNMTFIKPGAEDAPDGPTGDGGDAPATPVGESELQKQWNGTWYGVMYVNDATGDYAPINGDEYLYDVFVVVDVDAAGEGDFAVYIGGAKDAFVKANCTAFEYGLDAKDGTVAGGFDLYAYNWMFRANPNYKDQFTITDEMEHNGNTLDFTLFMKKWGGSWQEEVNSGFAIVPPSVEAYHAAIASGANPPVGFAQGGAASGNASTGNAGNVGFSGATEQYNYFDTIFVTYPTDTFFFDDSAILDTIAAKDETVQIMMVAQLSEASHQDTMEYYDSYATSEFYSDYTTENLIIAGFDARRITYKDNWGQYTADVHVNFDQPVNGKYGINFSIISEKSLDYCLSDDVMAILNSLELAQ